MNYAIYADTDLPHRARSVYLYLCSRSDGEGKCWPSIGTIAAELRLSRSTVKRALDELEQHGCLLRQPRQRSNGGSTSNLYTLL